MATGLIDVIKRAAIEAMNNAQLCDLRFGKVIAVSPLKVQVTNQFTIPESLLIVPKHLTDYEVEVEGDWIGGIKTMKINNALKVDDKIVLLRKTGGQSYFILDRI